MKQKENYPDDTTESTPVVDTNSCGKSRNQEKVLIQIISIAIVDDDERFRSNLVALIERHPEFRVSGTFGDAESALVNIPDLNVDVVLMDINLPGMDGVECVSRLMAQLPKVQILMLTVYEDNERLFNSLLAGANGYLLKRSPNDKLVEAIREVFQGGSPMTPQIARRVVLRMKGKESAKRILGELTPRENEVLEQLALGARYKEICDQLDLSFDTVRFHIRHIYEKLRVHSRTEAVIKYLAERPPKP